jgi:hypothetical protein
LKKFSEQQPLKDRRLRCRAEGGKTAFCIAAGYKPAAPLAYRTPDYVREARTILAN